MNRIVPLLLASGCTFLLSASAPVRGKAEWPQWRGPKRDGISTDTGLLKEWPKEGPLLLWEAKGAGRGYASVSITGGRIYTMGEGPSTADDKDLYVVCFEEETGKQLWKTRLDSPFKNYAGSRSTPTVDGELLYVLSPHGALACLESQTGKERWRKSLKEDFGGDKGDGWGYSESILVDGDRVVCTPGREKATMACLNKKTGDTIWTASVPKDKGAGHASIMVAEVGGVRMYVTTTASGGIGVRASDGKAQWSFPFGTTAVIPTPIVKGELVFLAAGYGLGGALLKQVATAEGGVSIEKVYGLKSELNNKHGGIVLVGEHLYGDTNDKGAPWCAEFATGAIKWKAQASGKDSASITVAESRLYIRFQNGLMVLANASPEEYKELGSFKIPHSGGAPSWSHPVVAGQKLFLREGDYILCYDLKAK